MEPLAFLFVNGFLGVIAAVIASGKGRSVVGWFFGGFFLGIIGIVIVACLSNRYEEAAREKRQEMENRRLREQLKQEKLKTEAFRRHAALRLDVHDQYLGIDTRGAAALPGVGPGPAALPLPEAAEAPVEAIPSAHLDAWYYEKDGATKGPVTRLALRRMLENGKISATTLVWQEGLPQWTPLKDVPVFQLFLPS